MSDDLKKEKEEQIRRQVQQLQSLIKDAEKQIEEVQKDCSHPEESTTLKDTNPEGGSALRRVCDICQKVIGYPTQSDLDEYKE